MKIARIFLIFFSMIFTFASFGFYGYILMTPMWSLNINMIPLYLYPARMFLLLSILVMVITVVITKKSFNEKMLKIICIGVCISMVCIGVATAVCSNKDCKNSVFVGMTKVDTEPEREKYVPYNALFESEENRQSEYMMEHKAIRFASHVQVENYFCVSTYDELSYGAELFKSDNKLLRLKFNASKSNPLADEPLVNAFDTVGDTIQKNGIDCVIFENESGYVVKIEEHDEIFYIYLLNGKKYGVNKNDFLNVATEQYNLLSKVSKEGDF